MKVKNPLSQNIDLKRSIKKSFCKTEKFWFFKVCSFMHSILRRGSFSTKMTALVRCGMEAKQSALHFSPVKTIRVTRLGYSIVFAVYVLCGLISQSYIRSSLFLLSEYDFC